MFNDDTTIVFKLVVTTEGQSDPTGHCVTRDDSWVVELVKEVLVKLANQREAPLPVGAAPAALPETHVQVQTSSGASGTKHHQIIIDIKQDIDMDELSTRALTESVMETLAARSVLIDNASVQHHIDESSNIELETLTTVNVIVASDPNNSQQGTVIASNNDNMTTAGRVVADRIAELTAGSPVTVQTNTETTTNTSTPPASSSTASGTNQPI